MLTGTACRFYLYTSSLHHGQPRFAGHAACAFLTGCRKQAWRATCLRCGQPHSAVHAAIGCKLAQGCEQARGAPSVPQGV